MARQWKMFDKQALHTMNNLVFRIFLPLLLCKNIMSGSESAIINKDIFLYAAVGIFSVFALLFLIIPILEKDDRKRGVMIQGIGRSNYTLFGIPLVQSFFPNSDVGIASLLVMVVVPIFNVLSIISLEIYSGGKTNNKKIIKGIITNPLIIGSTIGLLLLKTQVALPQFILSPMNGLAQIAAPFALFLLGGSLEFSKVEANLKQLIIAIVGKLVISPLIFLSIAVALGFRGVELACLLIVFGSPTAVNSYIMAQQMGGDEELAGQQVFFSTALSIITIFIFVLIAKQYGLF